VPPDADIIVTHQPGGCCSSSDGRGTTLLAGLVVIALWRRRGRVTMR
jgi:MYXO-CTERM domain-containing protein